MSIFVEATPAPELKTRNIRSISVALAGVLVVLVVAQLFTFEKFSDVVAAMWLPGGTDFALLWAAVIVSCEVMALPFLLRMQLSPSMRIVSMVVGWVAIGAWLAVSLWQNIAPDTIANSGLLGATVVLPVGWWSVLFCSALGVLAGWSAWGMWPVVRKLKK